MKIGALLAALEVVLTTFGAERLHEVLLQTGVGQTGVGNGATLRPAIVHNSCLLHFTKKARDQIVASSTPKAGETISSVAIVYQQPGLLSMIRQLTGSSSSNFQELHDTCTALKRDFRVDYIADSKL